MTYARFAASRLLLVVPPILLALATACGRSETTSSATTTPSTGHSQTAAPTATTKCPPPSGTAPEVQMKTYAQKPPLTVDKTKKYTAVIKTVRGDITIELRPDLAPEHVNS